ncbi:MAG: hypothetical protein JW909_05880 [Planctomycetes bacterium]|nr:hypothetical protein [Planctomycetota bacterium]
MPDRPTSKVRISKLPYKTEKALVKGRTLIVLTDIPRGDENCDRNVFGMMRDGTLLWRVASPSDSAERLTPFKDIYQDDKGNLMGRLVGGKLYRIDEKTGRLQPA